uniref:SGNH hydrolase-type esterase domain-containing protein n=1 Tax=Cyprinus carpio TaxID=7962 RepID=A0A8C1W2U5_CYPCA
MRSRLNRQQHSAQSAAEPRTLIVGDSIIRNISSRNTTTCYLAQATDSDVNKELQNILMKNKTANRIIIPVGKNEIQKEQSELLKKDFSEHFETLRRLKDQSFISGPLPAMGTNMFSRLLRLYTWLQRSCNIKGVNFIDNCNLFWGHRQLFKPDVLHPNKLGARVLKDNIYFSLRHPSAECANPFSTDTSDPSRHVVDTSHKDTDNTTQPQQALFMDTIPAEPCPQSSSQAVLYQNSSKTQHPRTTFWKTARECRTTYHSHWKHQIHSPVHQTLSLSPASPLLSFSQKMEELVYAGTKLSHSFTASPQISTKKWRAPQPPKPVGPTRPPPPVRAATTPGPKPSICCR